MPHEKAEGLIDTGAGCSGIDNEIAKQLKLIHHDVATVLTPSGPCRQLRYDAVLHIPALNFRRELPILGMSLAPQQHHVLIGRDILASGTLVYSGWKGTFEFCV